MHVASDITEISEGLAHHLQMILGREVAEAHVARLRALMIANPSLAREVAVEEERMWARLAATLLARTGD